RRGEQLRRLRLAGGAQLGEGGGQQVGHALGVGVAGELDAVLFELGAQLREVFDDAVVDDRHVSVRRDVGMGVAVGGGAVGRPSGVPDAAGAVGDADLAV